MIHNARDVFNLYGETGKMANELHVEGHLEIKPIKMTASL